MPDFKAGDMANPGTLFAELIDTARVEVTAKLAESDRANVAPGQPVEIRVDAAPEILLRGKVRAVSSVASRQMFDAGGERRFDIAFDVEGGGGRVRPGVSTALSIAGQVFDNVAHVPRAAIFDVTGQPTVYVKTASGFEPRPVKVLARTESRAIIEGLDVPADVALVNPTRTATTARPAAAGPSPQPGR
jgi:multidrug efflux pump subunit AcrA (membrane-fusion protein)